MSDASAPAAEPAPRRLRLQPLLPWLSLAYGAFSALTMHRGPGRAKLVAAAAMLL